MNQTRIGNYNVSFENSEEFHSIKKEVFGDECYQIDTKYVTSPTPIIIDAGAHIGLSTLYFKLLFPNAIICALEPNPENLVLLDQNINQNGLLNVFTIEKALSANTGKREFYVDSSESKWFSTGGFIKNAWNGRQFTTTINVECISLNDLVAQNLITHIDILKLDIEGAEQSVLKNSPKTLQITSNVIFEFHPTKDQEITTIDRILRKQQFHQVDPESSALNQSELSIYHYSRN